MKQEISLSSQKPLAVISVGTNSYGHPAPEVIAKLESAGFQVLRTDKAGDIEVLSDGKGWNYSVTKNQLRKASPFEAKYLLQDYFFGRPLKGHPF